MTMDTTFDSLIAKKIREENEIKKNNHKDSGLLSASILGWALQWQVLKYLKVPGTEIDDYTLRKFKRGEHVESFIKAYIGDHGSQVKVEYRGCVGYLDILYNGMPHEIKSVSNAKYRNIMKAGEADPQHILQAAFYALGLGVDHFVIDYIASDDYRITSYGYEASQSKQEIDAIIDQYNYQIGLQEVPIFAPRYKWQENQMYNPYPEFANMDKQMIRRKIESLSVIWKKDKIL